MASAIIPINGRKGRFQIKGTNISVEDQQIEFKTDRVEITGTEDQADGGGRTNQNLTDGVDSMSGTINAVVNADQMPAAQDLKPGAVLFSVKFFLDKNLVPRYCGASQALVLAIKYMGRLKDAWKFQLTVESTGGASCIIWHPQ